MNPDGSNVRPLYVPGIQNGEGNPDWSSDGSQILFTNQIGVCNDDPNICEDVSYYSQIIRRRLDGTVTGSYTFPSLQGGLAQFAPKWSPDGMKIVYSTVLGINLSQINLRNIDGSGLQQLTTVGNNADPSWQRVPSGPASFDFDGDGRSDISVFRLSDGVWYLNRSQAGFSAIQFGLSSDKITPADFDGDGKTDIAVFRDGIWYLLRSTQGFTAIQFGQTGDIPQPADYTGDGRAEIAVYRVGTWYVYNLANNQINAVQFGNSTDKPVASDYDGDNRADYAVYREGVWYLLRSTQSFAAIQFGAATDAPVSGAFVK